MTKRPRDLFGNPVRPPREDAIHAAIVEYLSMAAHPRLLWWHVPNGAMVKPSARMYFARLGALPGVADLCFVLPDKTSAFMEIKQPGGRLSPAQQGFQAKCALLKLRYRVVLFGDGCGRGLEGMAARCVVRVPRAWM